MEKLEPKNIPGKPLFVPEAKTGTENPSIWRQIPGLSEEAQKAIERAKRSASLHEVGDGSYDDGDEEG